MRVDILMYPQKKHYAPHSLYPLCVCVSVCVLVRACLNQCYSNHSLSLPCGSGSLSVVLCGSFTGALHTSCVTGSS